MEEPTLQRLKIDKEFRELIRPLTRTEFITLEENILQDGCREAICLWHGFIIDGHNRYEICRRHKIPFRTKEMAFESRAEVIQWICKNQLGRRNISEETRKYLIGVQYNSEKIINQQRNGQGRNQYVPSETSPYVPPVSAEQKALAKQVKTKNLTADRVATENHISHGTVQKYAQYSRAIDVIKEKCPELYPKLLSGHYKISHDNLISLSQLSAEEIRKIAKSTEAEPKSFVPYKDTRAQIVKTSSSSTTPPAPSIKDMPTYDPDAEAVSLCLTIPAWISSLNRACEKTNFNLITDKARDQLIKALNSLYIKTLETLSIVEKR